MIDVTVSGLALLLLAPIGLLLALAIKLDSRGPVLFVQERVGLGGRRFRFYKFRTMVPDAEQRQAALEHLNEANGPVFKIRNDPRITRVGRILRQLEPRRAAAALERPARRHEPGRSAAAAGPRRRCASTRARTSAASA